MKYLALVSVFFLMGCQSLGGIFGEDAAKFLNEAAEKAGEIGDATAKGAAEAVDVTCDLPQSVLDKMRDEINERTEKYDIGDFCVANAE